MLAIVKASVIRAKVLIKEVVWKIKFRTLAFISLSSLLVLFCSLSSAFEQSVLNIIELVRLNCIRLRRVIHFIFSASPRNEAGNEAQHRKRTEEYPSCEIV